MQKFDLKIEWTIDSRMYTDNNEHLLLGKKIRTQMRKKNSRNNISLTNNTFFYIVNPCIQHSFDFKLFLKKIEN